MASRLIIRIAVNGQLSWVLELAPGQFAPVQSGDQSRLMAAMPAKLSQIDVIVPGEAVLLLPATIPARSAAKLRQALPFAVEEHLLEGLDQYHLALGQKLPSSQSGGSTHRYLVAAVERQQMQQWVELLAQLPGQLRNVVPDTLSIAAVDGVHIWSEGDRTLVRLPLDQGGLGFAGDAAEVGAMLELMAHETPGIQVAAVSEWAGDTPWSGPRLATEGDPLITLANGLASQPGTRPPVNLLQGAFNAEQERAALAWRWLRYAAVIGAFALGIGLLDRGWQLSQAKARFGELNQQSEDVFRASFPELTRVVNPRAQMQQQLSELGGAATGAGFLGLLQRAGPALVSDQVQIEDLSYRDGELEVRVRADSYQSIEKVSQQLVSRQLKSGVEQVITLGDSSNAQLRISDPAGLSQ